MDLQELEALRRNHPGWRLLAADHAPLIISFLYRSFILPNIRTIKEEELTSKLDDYLFHLREINGDIIYPRSASEYLNDWTTANRGWLRKYYPIDSDEVHFDLTPATEKTIEWLASLQHRPFVGTESRLRMVFDLLRQLIEGTKTDPKERLADLKRRQEQLVTEIQRVHDGHIDMMDEIQVKDSFLQMANTARGLLSDFREVEQNFRDLDRSLREHIATWEGNKGDLLDQIFGEHDAISDSDQGRSFRAFWDFLMSPARQEELSKLLEQAFALKPVRSLTPDPRLLRVHFDWLEAGEVTQRTVAKLSSELRRFLDDKVWLENRRIMQIIRDIEHHALALRNCPPSGNFIELDAQTPAVKLAMEQPLFSIPFKPHITEQIILKGEGVIDDRLFDHTYVNHTELQKRIRRVLQTRNQISLAQLTELYPLEHGLSELVTYLGLASNDSSAIIDDKVKETIVWHDNDEHDSGDGLQLKRQATLPLVIFSR
ncbi:MAG: DUF3375 domain-containing protein [Deltaproteobacteria bacterium]|nr:DUF3375 domain-containing protein [Deltaproteobacteria bacterium]